MFFLLIPFSQMLCAEKDFMQFNHVYYPQEGITKAVLISKNKKIEEGGIVRGNTFKKQLSLVFTGHEYADGAETILQALEKKWSERFIFFSQVSFIANILS